MYLKVELETTTWKFNFRRSRIQHINILNHSKTKRSDCQHSPRELVSGLIDNCPLRSAWLPLARIDTSHYNLRNSQARQNLKSALYNRKKTRKLSTENRTLREQSAANRRLRDSKQTAVSSPNRLQFDSGFGQAERRASSPPYFARDQSYVMCLKHTCACIYYGHAHMKQRARV